MRCVFNSAFNSHITDTSTTAAPPPDSEMTTDQSTADPPATNPTNDDLSATEASLGNTAATTSSLQIGGDSSLPAVVGAVVGVLVFMLLLMVGVVVLVVCILTRRRFTDKGKPEVVSEGQVVEDSQRGGISNSIHSAETSECVCLHKINIVVRSASIYFN